MKYNFMGLQGMAVRKEHIFKLLFMKLLPVTLSLKVFSCFILLLIPYSEHLHVVPVCIHQCASSSNREGIFHKASSEFRFISSQGSVIISFSCHQEEQRGRPKNF
jgi:hypothetical protein